MSMHILSHDLDHKKSSGDNEAKKTSKIVEFILQEARLILPGLQALFGFQLIAVFNQTFDEKLSQPERIIHLISIMLTMVSIGLLMAPAAYDRLCEPDGVSPKFIKLATLLLALGMIPLMLSMCADFYLIARIITENTAWAAVLATVALFFFSWLWFVFPCWDRSAKL